jgi:hypothetical protein
MVSPVDGPRGEGLSVAPDWRSLPPFKIPKRLRHLAKDARGKDALFCWVMGTGPFAAAEVQEGLRLHPDSSTHGVLEPACTMHIDEFQRRLGGTRDAWEIIPEDPAR